MTGFIRWRLTLHRVEYGEEMLSHALYGHLQFYSQTAKNPLVLLLSIQTNHRFLVSMVEVGSMAEFLGSLYFQENLTAAFEKVSGLGLGLKSESTLHFFG